MFRVSLIILSEQERTCEPKEGCESLFHPNLSCLLVPSQLCLVLVAGFEILATVANLFNTDEARSISSSEKKRCLPSEELDNIEIGALVAKGISSSARSRWGEHVVRYTPRRTT